MSFQKVYTAEEVADIIQNDKTFLMDSVAEKIDELLGASFQW